MPDAIRLTLSQDQFVAVQAAISDTIQEYGESESPWIRSLKEALDRMVEAWQARET